MVASNEFQVCLQLKRFKVCQNIFKLALTQMGLYHHFKIERRDRSMEMPCNV